MGAMSSAPPDAPPQPQDDRLVEAARRRGLFARVALRTRAKAELVFPAAPSLAGHFSEVLADQFAALGRPFSQHEIEHLRGLLEGKLREALEASCASTVLVQYHTAEDGSMRIDYGIAASTSSIAEQYEHWVATREPPLFGALPDARVMAAAQALPAGARVLDIGAGTGRNSLPLARLGLHVDAIEPSPALAEVLVAGAAAEGVAVRVAQADIAAPAPVEAGVFDLVVASQVTSHFRGPADLRALLRACAVALKPGGKALITAFVTRAGYRPDRVARELGQVFWTTFFTAEELEKALAGLPLSRAEDTDALAYERAHQPAESWPPTGWYESWARGEDLFGLQASPSVTLRWLAFDRTHGGTPEE